MAGSDYYLMIISAHPPHWGGCLQFPILSPSFLISTQWRPVESPMNKGTFPLYLDLLPILHCRTSPHLALMNKNFSWVILIYLCGRHFSLLCSPKGGKVYASYFPLRFRIQFALLACKLSSLLGYIKVLFFRWFFFYYQCGSDILFCFYVLSRSETPQHLPLMLHSFKKYYWVYIMSRNWEYNGE